MPGRVRQASSRVPEREIVAVISRALGGEPPAALNKARLLIVHLRLLKLQKNLPYVRTHLAVHSLTRCRLTGWRLLIDT